jgi:site-specific DNA recombinase
MAPLGYDTKDRKIIVNDLEADCVRTIFQSYLKLGSLNLLMADLRKGGIVTKVRVLKTGQTVGGIAFMRGPLAYCFATAFISERWSSRARPWRASSPLLLIGTCSMQSRPN